MTGRELAQAVPLWLTVLGLTATCLVAVLVSAPAGAFVLAAVCVVLAGVRGTDRGSLPSFAVRSRTADVAALLLLALALVLLAPAGYLT